MAFLDNYVQFTFMVKIFFVILLLANFYLQKKQKNTKLQTKITELKEKTETVFIILMSLLIIYLFNPFVIRSVTLDYETKLLLFIFGVISIVLRLQNI
jgi:uncharacterized membrane protein YiaA